MVPFLRALSLMNGCWVYHKVLFWSLKDWTDNVTFSKGGYIKDFKQSKVMLLMSVSVRILVNYSEPHSADLCIQPVREVFSIWQEDILNLCFFIRIVENNPFHLWVTRIMLQSKPHCHFDIPQTMIKIHLTMVLWSADQISEESKQENNTPTLCRKMDTSEAVSSASSLY